VLNIIIKALTDARVVGSRITKPSPAPPSSPFAPASMSQMLFPSSPSSKFGAPPLPLPPIPSRQLLTQPEGYFYIHVVALTRNCLITICDHKHNPVVAMSAGKLGIKHSRRMAPEAAFSTTIAAFDKFAQKGFDAKEIELVFKGFGKARTGFMMALESQQGEPIRSKVVRLTDATPLQIGRITAPRPKRR